MANPPENIPTATPATPATRSRRELAEVSALADGSLPVARRGAVEARIAASRELSALYRRERRAVELVREASASTHAPDSLRARLERSRPGTAVRTRRTGAYGAGLAGALAAVVLALVLVLPGGTPGAPSVSQAAALAARGAVSPAPTPDASAPQEKLSSAVQDVYFPNWTRNFGWRATGQRVDTIGGRRAITVYYVGSSARIAYTIVSSPVLSQPRAQVAILNGTELRMLSLGGRTVVTWRRSGHTCVLSGAGVSSATLQRLAAWRARGLGSS